jgi:hypothetical protein
MKDAPNKAHIENINNIFKLAPLLPKIGRGGALAKLVDNAYYMWFIILF